METRAHYVLIGAFMLGGIVLAILFTLWLGSVEREYDEYEVVFTQKISGLAEGARVLFNGIPVGDVHELRLDPNDPNRSLALVRVEEGTPVKTDTKVELEIVGVTGLAVVQFTGGSRQAPLLREVATERPPQIDADLTGLPAVLESSGDIVLNIQRLFSQENAESASRILRDVEAITDVIADKETELALIIDNVAVTSTALRRSAENLDASIARIESTLTDIEGLIDNEARQVFSELSEAAVGVNELVDEVSGIVDENRLAIESFTQQGLGSAVGLVNKASRLVDTTQAILLEFDRDPARFLLGEGRPTAN
jgi:phospholipid/cholesterol/gamma-HCH transport system substrate-binding protein